MIWSFRTNGNYVDFVHTDETDLHEEILVHRLHNTSRCIDWSLPVDTTRISFTIDETRYENVSIYDIDFDGTSMNVQGDFETGITAMFPGLAGGGEEGGASYYVYTARVSQSGTSNHTTTVYENTLPGNITLARAGVGRYDFTSDGGAFTNIDKVVIPPFSNDDGTNTVWMPIASPSAVIGYYQILRDTSTRCRLITVDTSFLFAEFSTLFDGSGLFIEIRVYP